MDLLMNGLLTAATLFAGGYCWILARRVRDLKNLDQGLGGSIVTLTRQIELARATLDEARASARDNRQDLIQLVGRAESASGQLKLLLAAIRHPEPPEAKPPAAAPAAEPLAAPPALAGPPPEPAEPASVRSIAAHLTEVPKPRTLPAPEASLRRPKPMTDTGSEAELIRALTAIAAGGGR